jgi:hypothetical protein
MSSCAKMQKKNKHSIELFKKSQIYPMLYCRHDAVYTSTVFRNNHLVDLYYIHVESMYEELKEDFLLIVQQFDHKQDEVDFYDVLL